MFIWPKTANAEQNKNADGSSNSKDKSRNRPVGPWKKNMFDADLPWKNKKRQPWKNWQCGKKSEGEKKSRERDRRKNIIGECNLGVNSRLKKIQSTSNTTLNSWKIKTLSKESIETKQR